MFQPLIALAVMNGAGVSLVDGSLAVTRLAVEPGPDRALAITFDVATTDDHARDRSLIVRVPADAHVTALRVTLGGSTVDGELAEARASYRRYMNLTRRRTDPALLEQLAPGSLRLHVFPVSRDHPATITLVISDAPGVDARTSLFAGFGGDDFWHRDADPDDAFFIVASPL